MAFLEYLWQAPLVSVVNQALKPYKKTFLGTLPENVHRAYMAFLQSGYQRVEIEPAERQKNFYLQRFTKPSYELIKKIREQIGAEQIVLDMYFRFLIKSATEGKIPYEKYDPVGFTATQQLQKKFSTEKTTVEKIGQKAAEVGAKTIDLIPWVMLGAAGIAVYVIVSKMNPRSV